MKELGTQQFIYLGVKLKQSTMSIQSFYFCKLLYNMIIFPDLPCKWVFFYIWVRWNIALLLCLIYLFLNKHLTALHLCLAAGRKLSVLGNWHTL